MSPVTSSLLALLQCPVGGGALSAADAELVARLNAAIAAGSALNIGGAKVSKSINGGLVNEAGDRLYPIVDGIPVMLPDEAIDLSRL